MKEPAWSIVAEPDALEQALWVSIGGAQVFNASPPAAARALWARMIAHDPRPAASV
jgi:hypothetical protein